MASDLKEKLPPLTLPYAFTRDPKPIVPTTESSESTTATEKENYVLRPLEVTDFSKGYRDLLQVLSDPGDLDESKFQSIYNSSFKAGSEGPIGKSSLRTLVIEHIDKKVVVSTVTLMFEQKFLRGGKKVGHIEDVITHPDYQKRGLAKMILEQLISEAREAGEAYKLILDCTDANSVVYGKCDFFKTGEIQMRVNM